MDNKKNECKSLLLSNLICIIIFYHVKSSTFYNILNIVFWDHGYFQDHEIYIIPDNYTKFACNK